MEYSNNVNAGKGRFNKVKTSYDKSTGKLTVRYGNALLKENIDYKKDASAGLLISLETNFTSGTKKWG